MPVILGGPNARKVWSRGEFGLSLQYVNGEEALCIWPLRRIEDDGSGGMVICLSAAWQYADSKTGNPTPYCALSCMRALTVMRMAVHKDTVRKLADIIVDELPELIKMKPEPDDGKSGFEGEVVINGRTIGITMDEAPGIH